MFATIINTTTYYIYTIAVVVFIIILAYISTRFLANKSNNFLRNKNAKIIERTTIGLNLSVLVVRINKRVYILLQHYKQLELLDVLDEDEWINNRKSDLIEGDFLGRVDEQALTGINRIKRLFIKNNHIKGENNKNNKKQQ